MGAFAAGAVVLDPFPYSDLSQSKLRPALVLAAIGRGDLVLCQITSNPYADPLAVELSQVAFSAGSLHRTSYARPGKLFTASETIIVGGAGTLEPAILDRVIEQIIRLLRRPQN